MRSVAALRSGRKAPPTPLENIGASLSRDHTGMRRVWPLRLVALRFLQNNTKNTLYFWLKLTTYSHPTSYVRSAEISERFGLRWNKSMGIDMTR